MYNDLLTKGYACLRRGDTEAARVRFQHAIESDSTRPQGYFGLAQAYLDEGKKQELRQSLEKALEVAPKYAPARAFLAIECLKDYDVYGAEDLLEQALKDDPTNLLVHIKYAEYYYRLGFYPRAVTLLERGLEGPHGANEHIVDLARRFLQQARQKSKGIIIREPPDPRPHRLFNLFSRFRPRKDEAVSKAVRLS